MSETIRTNLQRERKGEHSERSQRGQSLVEMAVLVPVLLLLVAAIVDFGRVFDAYIVLTNAVREGARLGTLREPPPPEEEIADLVMVDVLGSGTNITQLDGFTAADNVEVLMGSLAVTVTASYDFDLWFGGLIGIPQVRVSKRAIMPVFYDD